MGPFLSLWLELALVGLATAFLVNRRLSGTQEPARCATALAAAADGRAALLRATCAASDSSWARLARASVQMSPQMPSKLEPVREAAAYRDAPVLVLDEKLTTIARAERARIRRVAAIGIGGVVAALLGAAMLIAAQSVAMGFMALMAFAIGWRLVANARDAAAALHRAENALPRLVLGFAAPPPAIPRAVRSAVASMELRSSGGCLGVFFEFGLALMCLGIGAGLISEMTHGVSANQIGVLLGVHFLLLPLVLALGAVSLRARVTVDARRDEIVITHRLFGIPYERMRVPMEIVTTFCVESVGGFRGKTECLAVHTKREHGHSSATDGPILLASGDRSSNAAAELNRAFGCVRE